MKKILLLIAALVAVACGQKTVTIIQIADSQLGFDAAIKGQAPGAQYVNDLSFEVAYLEKAVLEINRLLPDVVVFTGDQINLPLDPEQRETFCNVVSKINESVKVIFVPGNHDVLIGENIVDSTPFTSVFGGDRFVYEIEGVKLIGLNSNLIKYNDPSECQQKQWLQDELSKTGPDQVKIIFTHHPFFMNDIDEADSYFPIQQAKRREYFDLFAQTGVDAVYAGHFHDSSLGEYNGIPMRTTTSAAYQLGEAKASIRLITVENGSSIKDEFILLD